MCLFSQMHICKEVYTIVKRAVWFGPSEFCLVLKRYELTPDNLSHSTADSSIRNTNHTFMKIVVPLGSELLYYAITCNCLGVIRMLIEEYHIDPNFISTETFPKTYAINEAMSMITQDTLLYLLHPHDVGPPLVDIHLKDQFDQTPLHWACYRPRDVNIIQTIIDAKVDINHQDYQGNTALHILISNNYNMNICKEIALLLQHPAINPLLTNKFGKTPWQTILRTMNHQLVQDMLTHQKIHPFIWNLKCECEIPHRRNCGCECAMKRCNIQKIKRRVQLLSWLIGLPDVKSFSHQAFQLTTISLIVAYI